MPIEDRSSLFSYSQYRPVVSPCSNYVVFIHGSKLVIRSTKSLERIRTIDLSEEFIKITQVTWEHKYHGKSTKVGVLVSNQNKVLIFDVEDQSVSVSVEEDDIFGIDRFEWLPPGSIPEETAYTGCKQIAIYSKCSLLMKVLSLDQKGGKFHVEVEKPLSGIVNRDDGSHVWFIASSIHGKPHLQQYFNEGSYSRRIIVSELPTGVMLDNVLLSPSSKWILSMGNSLSGVKFQLFLTAGDFLSTGKPLLSYVSGADPFGATCVIFIDDETVCFGDHLEQVHILSVPYGFDEVETLVYQPIVENTTVFRQSSDGSKYASRPSPFSIPYIPDLPMERKGIKLLRCIGGQYIWTITETMPTTLFLWSRSSETRHPLGIMVTNTKIVEVFTPNSIEPLAIVVSEDSISIWKSQIEPLSFPITLSSDLVLKGAEIIVMDSNYVQLSLWTSSKHFFTVDVRFAGVKQNIGEHMEQDESLMRRGSPAYVDDSTRVVELAKAVQQNEWAQTTGLQVDDTFQGRAQRLR